MKRCLQLNNNNKKNNDSYFITFQEFCSKRCSSFERKYFWVVYIGPMIYDILTLRFIRDDTLYFEFYELYGMM